VQNVDYCLGRITRRIVSSVVCSFVAIACCIFFIPSVAHASPGGELSPCRQRCLRTYENDMAVCRCELDACERQESDRQGQTFCEWERENQPGFFEYYFGKWWTEGSSQPSDIVSCSESYDDCLSDAWDEHRICKDICLILEVHSQGGFNN